MQITQRALHLATDRAVTTRIRCVFCWFVSVADDARGARPTRVLDRWDALGSSCVLPC